MSTTQLIPSCELPGLETALSSVESLTAQTKPLLERARAIEVKTREEYQAIGEVLTEERALLKQGKVLFAPFDGVVERVRGFLQTQRRKHEVACAEIDGIILPRMKAFEQAELAATQAEQEQFNKNVRNDERVTVRPNLPPVAGYRRSTNYYCEVVDLDKFLTGFLKARGTHREYLQQFIKVDVQALNVEAGRVKDPEKLEKQIPGSRAWRE